MAITFARRPGAIRSTSNPPTFEEEWVCEGIFDSGVVKASAVNLTPLVVAVEEGLLYRNNIQVEEQGYGLYYVGVTYGEKKNEVGAYRFSGSTTGGTLHITHSRETVGKYPDTARGHNQAIDLGKDNVPRGTDVVVPALKLSYNFRHPAGEVNEEFARNLGRITGSCNEDTWHGFEPGEVLLLGGDFSDGTDAEAEVTYHVACEENLQDLVIGAIEEIEKDGHDFLWVWWQDNVEEAGGNQQPGVKPRAVYVERLYRRISFGAALGF
jgi:hypothetical protein